MYMHNYHELHMQAFFQFTFTCFLLHNINLCYTIMMHAGTTDVQFYMV